MLTSPITVTIDGTAHSLPRINQDNFGSVYRKKGDGFEVQLDIRHSYEKATADGQMERHNVDLKYTTFDPVSFKPTVIQSYTVIRSKRGADPVFVPKVAIGQLAFTTTNAAAITAWES
jgi:hypothetical protein